MGTLLGHDRPCGLEHHRDGGLVVGAEDRPAGVADDTLLHDRLESSSGRHRVQVRTEEHRLTRAGSSRQPAVQVACGRADPRPAVVLVPRDAEIVEVLPDDVRDSALLTGRARDRRELEEEIEQVGAAMPAILGRVPGAGGPAGAALRLVAAERPSFATSSAGRGGGGARRRGPGDARARQRRTRGRAARDASGRDLNSGWNWLATNHGWSGSSTISTRRPSWKVPGDDEPGATSCSR